MKVSLIQMESQADKAANLATAEALIDEVVERDRPDLVVLPEHFHMRDANADNKRAGAEALEGDSISAMLKSLATRHGIWLHGGSFCERAPDGRFHNTTLVFDPEGQVRATYRKIHMFDITAPDGTQYHESALTTPGREIVTYDMGDLRMGCAICYDLRFGELFVELARRGAKVIALPASFTLMTGKDHWETLVRTRAIDTQCYILAAGQTGRMADGTRPAWGNSMIVDPWGSVIARARDGVGSVTGHLDFDYQKDVRTRMPVADHRVLQGPVGF